jgi:tetratricopeptide (TPR) repeat protein
VPDLPLWKLLLFSLLVLVGFLAGLEGLLALAGVEPRQYREDPYVGFAGGLALFEERTDEDGRRLLETAPGKRRFFNPQRFPAGKAPGVRRAFCLGGSTTYGRPYGDATSFCGWLRAFLARADAGARWEVINAGGISYASYRVAALMDELADYAPDLFVVYSGHNEFLEERTYASVRDENAALRTVGAWLARTRTDAALRGVLSRLRAAGASAGAGSATAPGDSRALLAGEVNAILDRSVGPDAYERDEALEARVLEHYRFNLERIVHRARRAGAEVLLVVPAANLRDCQPFRSQHDETLDAAARLRFAGAYTRGQQAWRRGDFVAARAAFAEAVAIDPLRADAHYRLGQAQLAAGDSEAASRSFRRARDEDVCPLRALSPVRSTVMEVARERGVPVVDFEALVAARVRASQGHDAAGADWFLDHVHPTIEGHRLLALALLEVMAQQGWTRPPPDWNESVVSEVTDQVLAGVDQRTHGLALRNLAKVTSWAGKSEDAARLAGEALRLLGDDAECLFILGSYEGEEGRLEQAAAHYRRALDLDPRYVKARNNLGMTLGRLGRTDEAIAAYRQVLDEAPQHGNARYNLANALMRQGRLEEAMAQYREVLRSSSDDVDAHFNLARALERSGSWQQAAEHYAEVVRLDPEDAGGHEGLALALTELGRADEARAHFAEAERLDASMRD